MLRYWIRLIRLACRTRHQRTHGRNRITPGYSNVILYDYNPPFYPERYKGPRDHKEVREWLT